MPRSRLHASRRSLRPRCGTIEDCAVGGSAAAAKAPNVRERLPVSMQDLGPPRYDQILAPAGFERTLEVLGWVLDRLRERGVAPGPDSRLYRLEPLIRAAAAGQAQLATDSALRATVAEAQRTVFEFSAIANIVPKGPGAVTPRMRMQLQKSYGGADDPALDGPHQVVARNTQFELWLAAYLVAGGKAVGSAEPDLVMEYADAMQGIAAKRIRSRAQIVKRVQAAAKQVRTRIGTGFVAISLDNFTDPGAVALSSNTGVERGQRYFKEFPEVTRAIDWLQAHAPWIIGIICFGHIANWYVATPPPRLEMDNLVHYIAVGRSDSEVAYFNRFFEEHGEVFAAKMKRFSGAP